MDTQSTISSVRGTPLPAIPIAESEERPRRASAMSTMSKVSSFFDVFRRNSENIEPTYVEPNSISLKKKEKFDREFSAKETKREAAIQRKQELKQVLQAHSRHAARKSIDSALSRGEEPPLVSPRLKSPEPDYVDLLELGTINEEAMKEVQQLSSEKRRELGLQTDSSSSGVKSKESSPSSRAFSGPSFLEGDDPSEDGFEPIEIFSDRMTLLYEEMSKTPNLGPRVFKPWS